MSAPDPKDKVKDTEYSNWLKVTLALYYMKSGLHTFMQSEVDGLHQSLVQKIYGASTVPLTPCNACDAHHVKRNKYSGVWTFSKQCKSYCDVWLHELLALHTNPKSEKIYWDNSHVASWPFNPWECAKVFMPRGQSPSNVGPAECDAQAMLTMLANCKHFHHKLSPQGLGLTHTISAIRNRVTHDGEMKLSDADRLTYIQQIIQLLEDSVSLKSLEDCKAAVGNIQKIEYESLDVFFNVDIEMTGLRSAVNDVRLELGMQEKRTLDTVDSLKEEYKQLKEQLTNRFACVESMMGCIEKSVKDQTDNLLQQQEKYQELQATVTQMSADVTSNTSRLDTVEKKVEYIYNRMDIIDRSVEAVKQQTETAVLKQEKKYQEMHTTVTTHGLSLDTVKENLSLFAAESRDFKTNTETAGQQQEMKHQEMHTTVTSHEVRLHTAEKSIHSFGTELEELKANMLTQMGIYSGRERKAAGEKISKYNILETSVKRRPETDGLRQLKSQTEDKLDTVRRLECIPTTQAEEAKKLFEGNKSIVISGNPGEGKTITALRLIDDEVYRDRRVVVYSLSDWKTVDTDWVDVVVLEDILGQFDLDPDRLQQWIVYLRTVQEHVEAGKLRVIITTRSDILSKAFSTLGSIKLFSYDLSLTLSSEQLTNSEKMSILNREVQMHRRNINENEKEKCISNFQGLIGFPQCCSLFAGDRNLFDRGPDFFKSPVKFFVENISRLEGTRFLSLAFLFCSGKIQDEYLSAETMPESSKHLLIELASCLHISKRKTSITLLRSIYGNLVGLYVLKSISYEFRLGVLVAKPFIRFSHAVVCEAVGHVLWSYCPEVVIKYGNSEFLYQRTYTAKAEDITSQNIFIPVDVYGILAERIFHDVIEKKLVQSVVKHSALRQNSFLMKLKDELHKGNRIREFFEDKFDFLLCRDLTEGECATFLQYILQSSEDVVTLVYSHFLEFLACVHTDKSSDCWQCKEKQSLLELALYYHHFEIADKLFAMNACYTYTSLCNAAIHGDPRRVQTIVTTLKRGQMFSPVCGVAKDALCRAYISGHLDVIECFLTEGITLDSRHVVYIVRRGDMNALLNVTEHLKCHNAWNPQLEKRLRHEHYLSPSVYLRKDKLDQAGTLPFSTALYIAYYNEKFDIAYHLLKNGVIGSMDMLPNVLRYSSTQAVSQLVQSLKDTGTWDYNHCDASVALQIAYITHKYDVCLLLMQAGVKLTMEAFLALTESEASFTSVKKAIQDLKDTNSWDPKCDKASKALENAYSNLKYDVCDLLVQQGVLLQMTNLPDVTLRSLVYTKTALHQLKDIGNWDPKCEFASRALEYAYRENKHDVCDLLIQEGVSLEMKNLSGVICRSQASFESVKKAVQHLKETENWDPKCNDASTGLELAYIEKKYTVCDLLALEGITLTMKNLLRIVCNHKSSFQSVNKAIQQLKDTDNWDPTCDTASKVLKEACHKQNYAVWDLLIHEGVTVRMSDLSDFCEFPISVQYVKKAIHQLKDTFSWDPKCEYASKALECAYDKHSHDVCDLLIQNGVSLSMKNITGVRSFESVKKAIKHLKDSDNWHPKCDDASKALDNAYNAQRYEVSNLFVQEGVLLKMKNLPFVILQTLDSVKKAVQQLKDTSNWNPKCNHASRALAYAYGQQKYDVCNLLIQEGVSLYMKNLSDVICNQILSFYHVHNEVQHLNISDIWNYMFNAVSIALLQKDSSEKSSNVCDLLYKEEVPLMMQNIRYVTSDYEAAYRKHISEVSEFMIQNDLVLNMFHRVLFGFDAPFQSVMKAIQHLKDTNNWDPSSDNASKALTEAYGKLKYDVCDLLIQEGVSVRMYNLPYLCGIPISVQYIEKTIQQLRGTGDWEPTCDDASKALENAYIQQIYDVCDIMIQYGVTLTMQNLPNIILYNKTAFRSGKKAVKHLKDTGKWDPKCEYACIALEYAYSNQVYDVCNLLIKEGVSVTMMNLPNVILIPLDYVKTTLYRLKATANWDPKCRYASKALAIAYNEQKYDVCDVMFQEGFSLTMKNLSDVICNDDGSIESVKKVIQHMQDNNIWDPTCYDASKGLTEAYREERYDVCDLLIQEGVSVRMCSLPDVCGFPIPVQYIRKAIQQLKNNDRWDSKCKTASKTLEIAYSKQRYNVCELLIEEGVSLAMKNLPDIIGNYEASFESVKKAVQHLKDTDIWDPKCYDASKSLTEACSKQKYDVYDLLIEEGVSVRMYNLPGLIQCPNSVQYIKNTIQQLKDSDNWDSKCNTASKALEIAYSKQMYSVCDLLVQEGVSLAMKNLPDVIGNYATSSESVKKAVQHLRDSDIWDPKCYDASNALAKACSEQRYDVYDLLIEEGVSVRMHTLPGLVQCPKSFYHVTKAIQHLKDTNNWDPKCEHASEALKNAYNEKVYDVCNLLIQDGVSLSMRNLPGVKSFESVKKAMQHLKDHNSWDPKCSNASQALANAYNEQEYDVSNLLIQDGVSLTMKNLPNIKSFDSVKKAVEHLEKTGTFDPKCDDASEALKDAYDEQMNDVCELLTQAGVSLTMKNLPSITSLESVQKAIKLLKDTGNWDPTCDYAYESLENAYNSQVYDVCVLLVEEGVSITMNVFPGSLRFLISVQAVKKEIQQLKDTANWDPHSDQASKALEIAYSEQRYDVCDLLIQEGVSLTMRNLPGVICILNASFQSTKKAIKHLKESDSWDPECADASTALEHAYAAQAYDVCDQLVEEGVSLKMKNLLNLCGFEPSFKFVKKAIQHLKDTGNWYPMCDDASEALEYAYDDQMYDVCDLLIRDGVSLTMNNLPCVGSFESVKKAIQQLKDSNIWDPTCDDASEALEYAYDEQMYDVCDLLIQEGVSLTMKNLPCVRSFDSVKKVIQHMQDNNIWDPNCCGASKALTEAYREERDDVCDLLIQEGVSVRMCSLPDVCGFPIPVPYIKKAIQHLKGIDSWDSKCKTASKTLEIAYSKQRYNVCELLIEEGVSLAMKNLPDVIGNYEAPFESVKKAVQHLKDTDIWDPKCYDASKSLTEACSKQKYEVYDLLIEEGVSVRMYNLPDLMQCPNAVHYIKNAIQQLKDSDNWDSKCNTASKALEIAYSKQMYSVCDLLVQEGVSLAMKNLPDVIGNYATSSESVKKAVQHLRDTDIWDPKCYDASNAMTKACSEQRYDVYDLLIEEGVSIRMYNLPGLVQCPKSFHYIAKAIQHLKDTNNWDPKCDHASETLKNAYNEKVYDVCNLLIQDGVSLSMRNLPDVRSFESVKKAMQHLKDHDSWDPKCSNASQALANAYNEQEYDVSNLLIQDGVSLTMKNLPNIKSFDSVKKAIEHLEKTGTFDPKCDDASEALKDAYDEQMYDVCELLTQAGVSLTMKNLPSITSLESVQKAIKLLKDTGNWDPTCDYAYESLENAYNSQVYDVRVLLVEEGVSITMNVFPGSLRFLISVQAVKKEIQQLKDTANWDPHSDQASKALEIAYSEQRYDVCDLLIQEGVSLTMRNLPGVICILNASFQSTKKAIQHLKESDSWDPECADASTALEHAYVAQAYDVCDQLVEEGVSLKMNNLLNLCGSEPSFKFVKKAIQHLKDTGNWYPMCDDASEALEYAYDDQMYDVCDLLIRDGVSLTMKNLPGVGSFESVKKAIQQLKDSNIWDPTCDDASEALEYAYDEQMYDVCDLLIRHGVSLTMKNLPGVRSFESVTKAMQQLKDTNSWDPMCEHASKALENAYNRLAYDVCDILAEEGVSLTMKNFPGSFSSIISVQSVKKTIQHLKDATNWDPTCDYAAKALEYAYIAQKYDVCDLLIQDEVSLRMNNFPGVICRIKGALESVKKALQHLKDTDNWDPNCADASKALENAYKGQMYDICDLLTVEEVSLTMKNLLNLLKFEADSFGFLISIQSIKKAIQHLKDCDNWDPKCGYASKALEHAYTEHNYDLCHLMIQDGVSLTMKNLPGVVHGYNTSFWSVKKVIEHLKDTDNWDPDSCGAVKALENAYNGQVYDVCDLLVHEEVTLKMKNLSGLCRSETSLESVKKAIHHLKDTDIWNPKCDDAYEALEMACIQNNYDLFDLLVQEGVSSRNCLSGVVLFLVFICIWVSIILTGLGLFGILVDMIVHPFGCVKHHL